VANLDYSEYLGRLAIGRVFNGTIRIGADVAIAKLDGSLQKTRITKLYSFEGLKRVDETVGPPGAILAIAGVEGINIGETITSAENPAPLGGIQIDEPTIAMVVHSQHLAVRRQRRPVRNVKALAGQAPERTAHERIDSRGAGWRTGRSPRDGPRRTAAVDPHREHAPRRL
jgi:translation elongation factor EF-4